MSIGVQAVVADHDLTLSGMCKDKIRVSCRNTSGAALPHSPGTGSGQSHTSDCHSQDNARPPPGLPDGNTRTPSRTDPHILEEKARNIKENPIKNRVFRMTLPVDPCHGRLF